MTLAVTRAPDPLPCGLVSRPCAGQAGLLACVDSLFAADGTCGTTPDPTFPHFTALPFPNDYQALCTTPMSPCTGLRQELRFTVDTAGNLLIPMDWRGVLVNRDAVPVPRLLRGTTSLEAVAGTGTPIHVPGSAFLGSYDYNTGRKIPPIFDPQADPSNPLLTTLFGSADAPIAVLRVARRTTALRCFGGTRALSRLHGGQRVARAPLHDGSGLRRRRRELRRGGVHRRYASRPGMPQRYAMPRRRMRRGALRVR